MVTTQEAITIRTVGPMNLPEIDPITNPAGDNWLSRKIAEEVFGDELRYVELDQNHFDSITGMNMYKQSITSIPDNIGNLTNLEWISLSNNQISSIPESIGNLKNLTKLTIASNKINSIPESIGNLIKLNSLDLEYNEISSIPDSIINLTNLTDLDLYYNQISSIPDSIGDLMSLTKLCLSYNNIESIPRSIGNLEQLQTLKLSNNRLSNVSEDLWNLTNIKWLDLSRNQIAYIPEKVVELIKKIGRNAAVRDQVITLPAVIVSREEYTIKNPIKYGHQIVPPQAQYNVEYDELNNTIKFTDISYSQTLRYRFNVGNYSGTVIQDVVKNEAPTIKLHKSIFTIGEEITPLEWVTSNDDGDISKVKVIKVDSNIPFEVIDGKEYFKNSGQYTSTYQAIDEHDASTIETFEITVEDKIVTPEPEPSLDNNDKEKPLDEERLDQHMPYINGYPDKTFGPEKRVTRGEFAKMLTNILLESTNIPKVDDVFKDVLPSYFGYDAINYLSSLGIIQGYEGEVFKAHQNITRAEMVTILNKFIE